ncbi:hypothetical protein FQZ97_1169450 [compost metagenome]
MVGETLLVVRCNSFTPSSASSPWTCPEIVVFATFSASAAPVKLPTSTMRQNARIASNRSKAMIVRFIVQ